jgi:hypothetical protein
MDRSVSFEGLYHKVNIFLMAYTVQSVLSEYSLVILNDSFA